jgi:hypothetical protein
MSGFDVNLDLWITRGLNSNRKKRDGSGITSNGFTVVLKDSTLFSNFDLSNEVCYIFVTIPGKYQNFYFSRQVTLDPEIAYSTQVIEITYFCSSAIVYDILIENIPPQTCLTTYWSDINCMTVSTRALFILGIVAAIIAVLVIFITAFIKFRKWFHNRFRRIQDLPSAPPEEFEMSEPEISLEKVTTYTPKIHPKGNVINPVTLAILLFCCTCSACDQSIILGSQYTQCIYRTDSTAECSLQTSVAFPFPNIGAEVCLHFVDETRNLPVSSVKIKLISDTYVLPLSTDYWTSTAIFSSTAATSCSGSSSCNGGACVNLPTSTSNQKYFCLPRCGCANCGCVSCDPSCVSVAAQFLTDSGSATRVVSPVFGTRLLTVEVRIDNNPPNVISFQDATVVQVNGNMTASVTANYLPPNFFYDLRLLLSNNANGNIRLARSDQVSAVGFPSWDLYGAIQSPSLPLLLSNSFIIPAWRLVYYATRDSVIYHGGPVTFPVNNFPSLSSNPVNGFLLVGNSSHLVALSTNLQLVPTFSLANTGNYDVTIDVVQVCPKIVSYQSFGCYDCPEGFLLKINVYSTTSSGSVIMRISDSRYQCYPSVVFIDTNTDYSLNLTCVTQLKLVSFDITFSNLLCSDVLNVVTELNDPPFPNYNGTEIAGHIPFLDPSSGFSDWWDSLTGPLVTFKAMFIIGIVVLGFLLSLPLIFFVLRMCQGYRML